ncbi:putative aminopeptidase [Selenomonas ruminantium subsp. lactilytica TAM6421]|uniref:Putative aminopeptidase n=1 Tax=Selenomonas ruminantium subsp. lactilytica (strain NBRC 103574 / TAM6421) TaxID=927704 RepID=I0GSW6_SELRL|nr:aminopeptidase [Selenomonas ruminantium]BAL83853.1 putative aminopeptidase [Selenomonas ruminantium subsp. lactilytica TAM6421]
MQQDLLKKYAELVVRVGVNIQKDQILVINTPIECAEFAREISKAAFAAGAHDVVMSWGDELSAHIRFENGKRELFTEFPEWRVKFCQGYAEQGAAFVSIAARDPQIFSDIDPEKLKLANQAAGAALLEYRERLMSNKNTWCVVSVPTKGWAAKVFPEDMEEAAVEKLWQAIFQTVRIGEGVDTVEEWQKHTEFLQKAAAFLNEQKFTKLHYKNSMGTDLTIELPEGHIWSGGAEKSELGTVFVANMPTEEVFSLPKRDGVNGTVVASKPLNYNGNLIEGFKLTFKDGKVVDYGAEKGGEILKGLLETDEGASYLGEVALVPFDSPISQSGILFYNTLFDENASCHLALGKAYPTCIEGGENMDSVTLLQHGVNDSLVHEDFMVGTRDLEIIGTTADGREIKIFEQGNFGRNLW